MKRRTAGEDEIAAERGPEAAAAGIFFSVAGPPSASEEGEAVAMEQGRAQGERIATSA